MLTRKDFIKKADEFIKQLKDKKDLSFMTKHGTMSNRIKEYCEKAKQSNSRFDIGRFNDYIIKGVKWINLNINLATIKTINDYG